MNKMNLTTIKSSEFLIAFAKGMIIWILVMMIGSVALISHDKNEVLTVQEPLTITLPEPVLPEPETEERVSLKEVLPFRNYYESTSFGNLPKINAYAGPGENRPFDIYRVPSNTPYKYGITVVFKNVGLSDAFTQALLDYLPEGTTLLFSPYGKTNREYAQKAYDKGLEMWLSLPVETALFPHDDGGPYSLLQTNSDDANLQSLNQILGKSVGYAGLIPTINNIMTGKDKYDRFLSAQFINRGLAFYEFKDMPSQDYELYALEGAGLYAYGNTIIAKAMSADDIATTLQNTLARAKDDTHKKVVVLDAWPSALNGFVQWYNNLENKNVLIPLSAHF